jgi:hypothetical protein
MTKRAATGSRLETFAPLLMFILVFAGGFLTAKIYQFPLPRVHDEFAYLLAADTFASGRITNPPNPEPRLLESFHVIQQPSYQAKYPPGQGFFLATGQTLLGHPAWGIWLAMALATAAMFRLLRMACPPWPASVLSLAPLLCPPLFWQWTQSYWGGGAAYAGAALFFLGFAGSIRHPKFRWALVGALGLLLLSQARPLEGGLTCTLSLVLAWCIMGKEYRTSLLMITCWMAIAGFLALLGTLAYNHAVTGEAFSFPHRHWSRGFHATGLSEQLNTYTGSKPRTAIEEILRAGRYFIGPFLLLVLPGLFLARERGKMTGALVIVALLTAVSVNISAAHPHYLAPILPLVTSLVALAWLALWKHPRTRVFAGVILGLHVAYGSGRILHRIYQRPGWDRFNEREQIAQQLKDTPGQHLVFVRYTPGHDVHAEYVYNAADPGKTPVIWAREGTIEQRAALLEIYPGRQGWLLEADRRPNTVNPYPATGVPSP